jgi:hypothetical protein
MAADRRAGGTGRPAAAHRTTLLDAPAEDAFDWVALGSWANSERDVDLV